MAFIVFCFVVTIATLGWQIDASCTNKLTLEDLQIIDKSTGSVITSLPIKADKNLKFLYTVKANSILNAADYYTVKLSLITKIHHSFGNDEVDLGCPEELQIGCTLSHQSCNAVANYLGVSCPLLGSLSSEYDLTTPIGDLTSNLGIPSFLLWFLQSADLKVKLAITDDTTGEEVACIHKTIHFYKDF